MCAYMCACAPVFVCAFVYSYLCAYVSAYTCVRACVYACASLRVHFGRVLGGEEYTIINVIKIKCTNMYNYA